MLEIIRIGTLGSQSPQVDEATVTNRVLKVTWAASRVKRVGSEFLKSQSTISYLTNNAHTMSLWLVKIGSGLKFAFAWSRKKIIVKQIMNVNHVVRNGQKHGFWSSLDPGLNPGPLTDQLWLSGKSLTTMGLIFFCLWNGADNSYLKRLSLGLLLV